MSYLQNKSIIFIFLLLIVFVTGCATNPNNANSSRVKVSGQVDAAIEHTDN
ncbi:hypothetical protein [Oleidesulfovibrio sp.]|uniref:hypothetical protein n=1 Tax=Oleidesulfovibrio sp. TaxID=2909707 RepID=UPI003A86CE06